jgi:pantetheine-phosphate adenylyltransferase
VAGPETKDRLEGLAMTRRANGRVAVYTGTFDPITFGHLDIIRRGSELFERLVVGVGLNPEKTTFLSPDERLGLVQRVVGSFDNVSVKSYSGLTVHFVRQAGARVILRGLRTTSDMEYEFSMSLANQALDPDIETVFLMAKDDFSHVSSTLIRQIATLGGNLDKFVPPDVKEALLRRVREHPPSIMMREEREPQPAER